MHWRERTGSGLAGPRPILGPEVRPTARNQPYPRFRLPTEAEWEYVCRAGTTGPFSFGDDIIPEQANYDGNFPYRETKKDLRRQATVDVASLPTNPWGLSKMHGNVWEWCSDRYGDYPAGPVTDPADPPTDGWRSCAATVGSTMPASRAPCPVTTSCPATAAASSVSGLP
jgi:formylglycine-generating enzyme required for sulfatase activity